MKMTVKKLNKALKITVLALLSIAGVSCSVGLGEEVDLQGPVVSLLSHSGDNDPVSGEFTLSGYATDNEKVTKITVDFDEADIHYQVTTGGIWQKKTSSSDWTDIEQNKASCTYAGNNKWNWSVYVDTVNDKADSFNDSNFTFKIIAEDAMKNSGKLSKIEGSLTVDKENPDSTIYKPDLFATAYNDVKTVSDTWQLKDSNIIKNLFNGDITLSGRLENSATFKELRIDLDSGELTAGIAKVTGDELIDDPDAEKVSSQVSLGDTEAPVIYYTKTLYKGENGIESLRNWEYTIPAADWVSSEKNPDLLSGKHVIRIVTTCLSDTGAWQKKIIGYFVWYPEADVPWITTYTGDTEDKGENAYEIYPSSSISGSAQDDDGIASLTYTLNKKNNDGSYSQYKTSPLALSGDAATYSSWSVLAPTENGSYSLTLKVTDIYGSSSEETRYFRIMDVQPPKIQITSPEKNVSALMTQNGDITFTGKVTDDGTISAFAVVYLNPSLSSNVANKIKYMSPAENDWEKVSASNPVYKDSNGNLVCYVALGDPSYNSTDKCYEYSFTKTFNLFSDLNIGLAEGKNLLKTQDFIFRAKDNGKTRTILSWSLTGDTTPPVISFNKMTLKNNGITTEYQLTDSDYIPNLPVIVSGATATITGTWSDNSTTLWNDASKTGDIEIDWASNTITATKNLTDGTWTATITPPGRSGVLTASLRDFGGNTSSVSRSVFIETANASLERVGSDSNDGAYKAGDKILISLEFTKNVTFKNGTKNPELVLNTGGKAVYKEGNTTAKHVFEYTVSQSDINVSKLDVTAITANGNSWYDTNSDTLCPSELPTDSIKLLKGTRNIEIDTVSPVIESVTAITSPGYYMAGSSIILMLKFNEAVTIDNQDDLSLVFNHKNSSNSHKTSYNYVTTGLATATGSMYVLFTYDVEAGDSGTSVVSLALKEILLDGVTVKDTAGNTLTDSTLPSTDLTSIKIDTSRPAAPVITENWDNSIVFQETSFTLSGEDGATLEYSTDNGETWQSYSGEVYLRNNGTFTITARQTDQAGNQSDNSVPKQVNVDKGNLLNKITATTQNGIYSASTETNKIAGKITFRRALTLPKNATVTLKVGSVSKTITLNECKTAAATGTDFTFTYVIEEGDNSGDDYIDVTGWSLDSSNVTLGTVPVSMKFADVVTDGKSFAENREIRILTGQPEIESVTLTGEGENAVLTIKYNRRVTKSGGNIVFTQDTSSYRVPAVLSSSEYGELLSVYPSASSYYTAGVIGAEPVNSLLENYTTTKYILNFNVSDTDTNLINAFTEKAGKHLISIPVVASAVTVNEDTLTVKLGSAYKLPVKGASYTLSIPAGMVIDEVQNKNTADSSRTFTAAGVEAPVIRIKKESYAISGAGNTKTASVSMPATAQMRIDCRTPGAAVTYSINTKTSTAVQVIERHSYDTKTDSPSIPVPSTAYTTNQTITLGDSITGYNTATGQKFAIAAKAVKGTYSELSYEYATRTVLRFKIDSNYDSGKNSDGNQYTHINENDGTTTITDSTAYTNLQFKDLRVWVIGGDSPAGGNSIGTFPLSWGASSGFKLMNGSFGNIPGDTDTYNMHGQWYWVTWELSAPAYHGFVIGDVPSDAETEGPTCWYASECSWVGYKDWYVLYPGETLEMMATTGSSSPDIQFRLKNKGTR